MPVLPGRPSSLLLARMLLARLHGLLVPACMLHAALPLLGTISAMPVSHGTTGGGRHTAARNVKLLLRNWPLRPLLRRQLLLEPTVPNLLQPSRCVLLLPCNACIATIPAPATNGLHTRRLQTRRATACQLSGIFLWLLWLPFFI